MPLWEMRIKHLGLLLLKFPFHFPVSEVAPCRCQYLMGGTRVLLGQRQGLLS